MSELDTLRVRRESAPERYSEPERDVLCPVKAMRLRAASESNFRKEGRRGPPNEGGGAIAGCEHGTNPVWLATCDCYRLADGALAFLLMELAECARLALPVSCAREELRAEETLVRPPPGLAACRFLRVAGARE